MRRNRGMTLMELMTAMAISSIVVGSVISTNLIVGRTLTRVEELKSEYFISSNLRESLRADATRFQQLSVPVNDDQARDILRPQDMPYCLDGGRPALIDSPAGRDGCRALMGFLVHPHPLGNAVRGLRVMTIRIVEKPQGPLPSNTRQLRDELLRYVVAPR